MFDQREVPVLLPRTSVDVAAKVSKVGRAEVGIQCALNRIQERCCLKRIDVHVTAKPTLYAPMRETTRECRARCKTGSQQRSTSRTEESGTRARVKDGKGRSRLDNRDSTDAPVCQQSPFYAGCGGKKRQLINVADAKTVRAIVVGKSTRRVNVALIVVRRIESCVPRRRRISRTRERIRRLEIAASPAPGQCRLKSMVVRVGIIGEQLVSVVP